MSLYLCNYCKHSYKYHVCLPEYLPSETFCRQYLHYRCSYRNFMHTYMTICQCAGYWRKVLQLMKLISLTLRHIWACRKYLATTPNWIDQLWEIISMWYDVDNVIASTMNPFMINIMEVTGTSINIFMVKGKTTRHWGLIRVVMIL